jgi:ComF family protein
MEPPLDHVLHRMKYSGCPGLARPLARLTAQRIAAPDACGITGVPLFRSRRRERGYNQADLLARELGTWWGVPFVEGLLERQRRTQAQARLDETERAKNVSGAFALREPTWVPGRYWVVMDDILTTGRTLFECLEVLRRQGAGGGVPLAVALA